MCRQGFDCGVAQFDIHALVRDADDTVFGVADPTEMWNEALPDGRRQQCTFGADQPFVDGGDDVRVLVRGEDVLQFAEVEVFAHGHHQGVVGHVAARVDERAMTVSDDQELVGLHSL